MDKDMILEHLEEVKQIIKKALIEDGFQNIEYIRRAEFILKQIKGLSTALKANEDYTTESCIASLEKGIKKLEDRLDTEISNASLVAAKNISEELGHLQAFKEMLEILHNRQLYSLIR